MSSTSSLPPSLSCRKSFGLGALQIFRVVVFATAFCGWQTGVTAQEVKSAETPSATVSADATASPTTLNGPSEGVPSSDSQAVTLATIRAKLRDLESNELQVRDAAEKELVAMGVPVLAFLPEVTSRTSGEMKVRLQRIRQALQQAKIGDYSEASTVSLAGKMTLGDAIQQITKQTGNPIQLAAGEGMDKTQVELAADDTPFWEVMVSLMQQANLRINAFATTGQELVLAAGAPAQSNAAASYVSGPFRLDVVSVRATRTFQSQLDGQLDLSYNLTWEPRLQPVFMQLPMQSLQAELPDGQVLLASNPQAAPEVPLNLGGCTAQIDLQLQRPQRAVANISRLSGEFTIAVPSDRHEYVFEKFGNGARQSEKYGDVTVTLEGARRNGSVYEMRLFVEFGDSQGALDSFRGWIMSNEAYLRDPKQVRLENVGLNTYAITPNAVGIAYLFQINGDPNEYKLIYESPAAITTQRITYELRDIELP